MLEVFGRPNFWFSTRLDFPNCIVPNGPIQDSETSHFAGGVVTLTSCVVSPLCFVWYRALETLGGCKLDV